MFSANENIVLRQHKRRIIEFVEATIPEEVLDLGTSVLVMQVSCKAPGCVPLETIITVVFPSKESVLPGLVLTKHQTTFQTKILMPMAEVTMDDVLEALPPAFKGGLQSMERLSIRARDVMLAQITQLFDDQESRKLMAEYLQQSLQEYIDRDCEAPEYGLPFPEVTSTNNTEAKEQVTASDSQSIQRTTGNVVIRRALDHDDKDKDQNEDVVTSGRPTATVVARAPSTNDWRRQQVVARRMDSLSSSSLLLQLQHAPGVRRPACPCCDPDNVSNVVDSMMML